MRCSELLRASRRLLPAAPHAAAAPRSAVAELGSLGDMDERAGVLHRIVFPVLVTSAATLLLPLLLSLATEIYPFWRFSFFFAIVASLFGCGFIRLLDLFCYDELMTRLNAATWSYFWAIGAGVVEFLWLMAANSC